jgi:hypothetical protein
MSVTAREGKMERQIADKRKLESDVLKGQIKSRTAKEEGMRKERT